jgi:hypothetical protein
MQGGCLCGQVRYEINESPEITAVCHCEKCQRQSGSAFSLLLAARESSVRYSGTMKTFHDVGDSGQPVLRKFCGDCGSPIMSEVKVTPGLHWIKAGTLDDRSTIKPTMQIFCDAAQPWVELKGLQSFPQMPTL